MAEKKPKVTEKVSKESIKSIPPTDSDRPILSQMDLNLAKQNEFLEIAKTSFRAASDARSHYDQEWLGRNLFWRGYQFSRYLPQVQTIVLTVRQSARVSVNLVAAYMRSIRNQVTSFRPKFEVLPTSPNSNSAQIQARYAQRLLDYYFDKLKLKMKIKETIIQALLYSIGGPWQIVYDNRRKEIKIWLLDPFDFYMDSLAEDPNEAEYMIKAVRIPLGQVLTNSEYNPVARREITGSDQQIAASPQKQFMIQATRIVPSKPANNSPTIILYEGFFRRYKEDGSVYIIRCIWSGQNLIPLLYEEIDSEEFDFIIYRGDINPKEPYGESWVKHVMPINRVINNLETSALEFNSRVAKGRIVVDRDSGVRAIHNVHGEIISKNRGTTITALDLPPLPVSVPQQIERMVMYSQDVSGVHEATLGRLPTGVRTGIAIAELKQADTQSQDDLVDNLEDFLSEVAMKILKKIAQNYSSYKVIKDLGVREGDEKYFAVIGSKFAKGKNRSGDKFPGHEGQVKIGPDWFDVAEISDDNNIRVSVGSWLGYTKEAMQQKVIQYYQMQLIDQATALKLLEFGDIDTIIQQTRIEALLKKNLGTQQQPGEVDQFQLAMTENQMMVSEGKEVPVSELDDHMVHIALHQEALEQGADHLIGPHIEKHQILMGSNTAIPGGNGLDIRDQMSRPTGQVPPEAPLGPPSGTELPQSNIPNVMVENQMGAQENMAPIR